MKAKTFTWRMMQRYALMKEAKGSGKAIIATARKMAVMIWHMLTKDEEFDKERETGTKSGRKAEGERKASAVCEEKTENERRENLEEPVSFFDFNGKLV